MLFHGQSGFDRSLPLIDRRKSNLYQKVAHNEAIGSVTLVLYESRGCGGFVPQVSK